MPFLVILLVAIALLLAWGVWIYNRFVGLRTNAEEAWADISVQLTRRHDLIPNLVETVKGYMAHEKGVLSAVTEARSRALSAHTPGEYSKAEQTLAGTLKTLFAVAEQYPDLKANTTFLELQRELSDTENKLQAARRFYNGTVRDQNAAVQSFPGNVLARIFGFREREFFELEETAAKEVPKVRF